MAPTPVAYFAAHHLGSQSAAVVTGSHNPPEYNGVKMVVGGTTLSGDEIQALRQRIERGEFATGTGKRSQRDVLDAYVERIAGDVKLSRKFKVAIDCGNGVTGVIAQKLYERLGCDVIGLYTDVDGRFPNHHPDPSQPKNVAKLVETLKTTDAELGIAFERSPVTLDLAALPPDLAKAIRNLPKGEPFILPTSGKITVNVMIGR